MIVNREGQHLSTLKVRLDEVAPERLPVYCNLGAGESLVVYIKERSSGTQTRKTREASLRRFSSGRQTSGHQRYLKKRNVSRSASANHYTTETANLTKAGSRAPSPPSPQEATLPRLAQARPAQRLESRP